MHLKKVRRAETSRKHQVCEVLDGCLAERTMRKFYAALAARHGVPARKEDSRHERIKAYLAFEASVCRIVLDGATECDYFPV